MRLNLFLICNVCLLKHQNYCTSRAKKPQVKKLLIRKYCNFCRKTQLHKEAIIK